MEPVISLTTDFGGNDPYVGVMKGVIAAINPRATVIDLCHGIPAHNVGIAALVLKTALPYFAPGSIHVAVVDPGVGGARKPILVETGRHYLIGPDNGVLQPAAAASGRWRSICLTNRDFHRFPTSRTFHGRDIFAPAAAHLSLAVPADRFGPELGSIQPLELAEAEQQGNVFVGEVIYVDGFSNLITNIRFDPALEREKVTFRIKSHEIHGLSGSYEEVPVGQYLATVGSWDLVEIAQNQGRAGESLTVGHGERVEMEIRR